jgi:hypothetical protein
MGREDTRRFGCRQHGRACTVTEQHAGAAVGPVDDAGKNLCTDDQRTPSCSGAYELVCNSQGVNKTRASRLDVECGTALNP